MTCATSKSSSSICLSNCCASYTLDKDARPDDDDNDDDATTPRAPEQHDKPPLLPARPPARPPPRPPPRAPARRAPPHGEARGEARRFNTNEEDDDDEHFCTIIIFGEGEDSAIKKAKWRRRDGFEPSPAPGARGRAGWGCLIGRVPLVACGPAACGPSFLVFTLKLILLRASSTSS